MPFSICACKLSKRVGTPLEDTGQAKMKNEKLAKSYRIEDGKDFRLKDYDPADTDGWHAKERAEEALQQGVARLAELQDELYAQDRLAVLLIFQRMPPGEKHSPLKQRISRLTPHICTS